jgi:hypothetical protein
MLTWLSLSLCLFFGVLLFFLEQCMSVRLMSSAHVDIIRVVVISVKRCKLSLDIWGFQTELMNLLLFCWIGQLNYYFLDGLNTLLNVIYQIFTWLKKISQNFQWYLRFSWQWWCRSQSFGIWCHVYWYVGTVLWKVETIWEPMNVFQSIWCDLPGDCIAINYTI